MLYNNKKFLLLELINTSYYCYIEILKKNENALRKILDANHEVHDEKNLVWLVSEKVIIKNSKQYTCDVLNIVNKSYHYLVNTCC